MGDAKGVLPHMYPGPPSLMGAASVVTGISPSPGFMLVFLGVAALWIFWLETQQDIFKG